MKLLHFFRILIISSLFASAPVYCQVRIPEKPFFNSRFVEIDSMKIHMRVWNDSLLHPRGKVLMVHGFLGSSFSWRENIDTLIKEKYRIVAVDLPGFGYSERNVKFNQSHSRKAELLIRLIDLLDGNDTTKWNIMGHSMGGGTVEAMALIKPERIQSVIIVDGMVFTKNGNVNSTFVVLSRNKQYNRVFSSMIENKVFTPGIIRWAFKRMYGYTPDSIVVAGYLDPLMIDGTAECVLNVWSNSKEVINLNVHNFEKMPILVVWGEKDKTIHLNRGKRFVRNVVKADLKVIPDAYHDPMETHPGIFNRYMVECLNRNNEMVKW